MYPGRAPGGNGPTGLMSMDKSGYSDMLNNRLRYMRLGAALKGDDEPYVRADPRSNFRTAFAPLSGDARLPMYQPFEPDRDFYSAPGASLSRSSSALGPLLSRQRG